MDFLTEEQATEIYDNPKTLKRVQTAGVDFKSFFMSGKLLEGTNRYKFRSIDEAAEYSVTSSSTDVEKRDIAIAFLQTQEFKG